MQEDLSEIDAPSTTTDLVLGFRRNLVVLSATSFLTDASNNMVFPLMALFLDNVLGVKPALIGLVEGMVECAASLLKVLSGWLSDRLRERKRLIAGGYWFSTAAKAFLVIAGSWWSVLLIRFVDRVGKGLRAAPAQALVADASRSDQVGRTFGFYKTMDVSGGMMGLVASGGIIFLIQGRGLLLAQRTYQVLVVAAMLPASIGALLVTLLITEKQRLHPTSTSLPSISWQGLGVRFRMFLVVSSVFALGSFSDAFLALRAQNVGVSMFHLVLLLVVFRAVYSLVAWPMGALSDRIGRKRVLVSAWMLYVLVHLGSALAENLWHVLWLYLLYGLYHGVAKGAERAFVADLVPASEQRGTAYGIYNALLGLIALPASALAGILWQASMPAVPFLLGAVLVLLAVLLLLFWLK